MADNEQKAMDLMAQADKKANSTGGFFGKIFGSGTKLEEAAELYVRAANTFKMAKKWAEAVNCIRKSIDIYTDMGRFTIAAKHHVTVAEIYETELNDIDQAIANYEQAGDYYKGEESKSSANKCLLKVAQYCGQMENYDKAIKIYEQVGAAAMDNQLLRYSAKDHFFRSALCHLCRDVQDAANAVARYEDMFPAFTDARECKLVKKLIAAIEEQDVDAYTEAVREYDSISRLEQWYTTLLLRIKKKIEGEEDLR